MDNRSGKRMAFGPSEKGLYYHDMSGKQMMDAAMVTTVEEMKENITRRDIEGAKLARYIYKRIGRPGNRRFMELIDKNLIPGCPVTRQGVINAEKIWGPDAGALKGKTTRKKGKHFKTKLYTIPMEIMSKYQEVTICGLSLIHI